MPLLAFDGLTRRYGAVLAVDAVTAAIDPGELVSFVGPSGCGKTTLLRLLGGFLRSRLTLTAWDPEQHDGYRVFLSRLAVAAPQPA